MPEQTWRRFLRRCPDRHQTDRANWRVAWKLVAVFGALTLFSPCEHARAQQAQQPQPEIIAPPTIVARPGSKVRLAINVRSPAVLPKKCFVNLRGLPPSVSLSGSQNIGSGSWTISLLALPTLTADIPLSASGRSQLTVSLIAMDGSLLAQAQTTLLVDHTSLAPPAEGVTAVQLPNAALVDIPTTNPPTTAVLPTLSVDERARAEHLVAQGEKYLGDANVEAARQFFRRAADAGLATAALRLAATYDPAELVHLQATGVLANRAEARRWYERARELGATEAEGRLARLGPDTR
jgi:hypothetical protein